MGVKLGTLDISSFKVGSADCKVYLGETLLYSGDTPTPPPLSGCSIVVDEISGYTGTTFDEAFNLGDMKWYMLNNNSQYEEYGVYGSGRNITTYEGKLTIDGDYEYQYSGSSWVNVGQVTASTGVDFRKYVDQYSTYEFQNQTIPTSFKILKSDVALVQSEAGSFSFSIQGYQGNLQILIDEYNTDYSLYDTGGGQIAGTITEDNDFYIFNLDGSDFQISQLDWHYTQGFTLYFEMNQFVINGDEYNPTYFYNGTAMPTSFSIPCADVDAIVASTGGFNMSVTDNSGTESLYISDQYYSDSNGNQGTVTNDGTNYVYSMAYPTEIALGYIQLSVNYTVHIVFGSGGGIQVPVSYASKSPIYAKEFNSVADMENATCPTIAVGEYAIVGNDTYRLNDSGLWDNVSAKMIARGSGDSTFVIPCVAKVGLPVSSITRADYINYPYDSISALTIPSGCITTIGTSAFYDPNTNKGLDFTTCNIENGVTEISFRSFYKCTSLSSITLPDSLTSIDKQSFWGCSGLTSVTIPSGVTSIGDYTFAKCSGLSSATIPNSVTSIGTNAFEGCSGLTSIDIPDSVTRISGGAFTNCSALTSITIGSGITWMGGFVLYHCTSLTSITFLATTPPTLLGGTAFNDTGDCPIYVPAESVDTYKAESGWSNVASRIQAIQ